MDNKPSFNAYDAVLAELQAGRNAQIANMQAYIKQQNDALDEQHLIGMERIKQQAQAIGDAIKYPEAQHDIKRAQALLQYGVGRQKLLNGMTGRADADISRHLKLFDDDAKMQYGQYLKPFDESEQYKAAKENWAKLRDNGNRVLSVKNGLVQARDYLDKGQDAMATSHMKTNVMKALNSIISNDAVQLSEMLIRYPDLLSAADMNVLSNKGVFSPAAYVQKIQQAKIARDNGLDASGIVADAANDIAKTDESNRSSFVSRLLNEAKANPRRFYDIAVGGLNSAAKTFNDQVDASVYDVTSPKAGNAMGAYRIAPLTSLAEEQQKKDAEAQAAMDQLLQNPQQQQQPPQQPAMQPQAAQQPQGQFNQISGKLKNGASWIAVPME